MYQLVSQLLGGSDFNQYKYKQCNIQQMSDLLLNWLNDEIQLSKRITNFEEDFHNGYLFGQLLSKYSQQLNFHQFINKDDKDSRIKNYMLLLDTFTSLRVAYDSIIAMKIINKNYGVAKKVLYELKTQLEKTNANAFSKSTKMTKTLSPLKKIQISKEKYDEVNREHFIKQLNKLHPAQKQINQERILKKFGDFHQKTNTRATILDEKQKQAKVLLRNKFIQHQNDNLKKSQQFRKQWEAGHAEKWIMNMTIRKTQVHKDQLYRSKNQNQKLQNKTMAELNAVRSLESDIEKFQKKNLKDKPKIIEDSSEDEQPLAEEPGLNKSVSKLSQNLSKAKHNKTNNNIGEQISPGSKKRSAQIEEKAKHQREKRRRKMIVQQNKRYQMIDITRRQRYIVATIEQTSKQEKQIQYEIWRAWQNKNIIKQNKELTDQKIKEKSQTRAINAQFKKDQLLKLQRQQHEHELQIAMKRFDALQISNKIKNRKQTYIECVDLIDSIIEMTEKIYINQQQRNNQQIDSGYMEHLLQLFVENINEKSEKKQFKSAGTYKEEICKLELKNYVEGKGQWNIAITKAQEPPTPENPVQDNAIPVKVVNNYYLGNILKYIFEKYYQDGQESEHLQNSQNKNIIISLLGLDYSGKKTLAKALENTHNLTIIEIEQVIQRRIQQFYSLSQKNIEMSQETKLLMEYTIKGQSIPNDLVIALLRQEILKEKQRIILLVDFPNTYQQAIALTKVLKNIQPTDYIQSSKLQKKIQQFSRLVTPTSANSKPTQRRQCGIDFVVWIDIPVKQSLDRMLGRRFIKDQVVHIRENIQDANMLEEGEKASSLILRNNFKLQQIRTVREYLSLFGLKFHKKQQQYSCFSTINGNVSLEDLIKNVSEYFGKLLGIKKEKQEETQLMIEESRLKKIEKESSLKKEEENKAKCLLSTPQQIKNRLKKILQEEELQKKWLESLTNLWNMIENSSINGLTKIFYKLYDQRNNKNEFISKYKKQYIGLLLREDQKQFLIKRFQIEYNIFIHQNVDILSNDYTKQELHQRVEDLQNQLLSIIQEKKQDAIAERGNIINSGWLQSQFQIFYQCLYSIVQIQLNKFGGDQKILNDFYCKKYKLPSKEGQVVGYDLNQETIKTVQSYTKEGMFPRLDKLISEAFRVFNKEEEVVDDKNKKGGKVPPPAKKDDKKAGKKGKDDVQEVKEPTPQQLQLKKAINTEKAILRHRLYLLKEFSSKYLSQFSTDFTNFQKQLQDYLLYTFKEQQQSIFTLTKEIKIHIQSETKIQNQITISNVEIIINQNIRNFEKEIPIIMPAKESIKENVFTISNIKQIYNFIKNQAEGERISNKRLIALLKRFVQNQQLRILLPQNWKGLTSKQLQQFVLMLDNNNQGYVELNKIFVFILLNDANLPKAADLEEYQLQISNFGAESTVSEQKFIKTPSFFDLPLQESQNTRSFNYSEHLKRIFFNKLKNSINNVDSLDVEEYIQLIALKAFKKSSKDEIKEGKYYDFAFPA